MNATPTFIFEVSYYALVQCSRLLTSAVTLYKAGDYATAVGLAALAHEELSRSRYLKDQRKKVVGGGSVSVEKIRNTCRDHELKQEWGQSSVFQRFSVDSGLGKLLENRHRAAPRSKERQEYDWQVDEITDKQKGRTPQDRHNERMKAIYLEPNDHGTDWNKPWEQTKRQLNTLSKTP